MGHDQHRAADLRRGRRNRLARQHLVDPGHEPLLARLEAVHVERQPEHRLQIQPRRTLQPLLRPPALGRTAIRPLPRQIGRENVTGADSPGRSSPIHTPRNAGGLGPVVASSSRDVRSTIATLCKRNCERFSICCRPCDCDFPSRIAPVEREHLLAVDHVRRVRGDEHAGQPRRVVPLVVADRAAGNARVGGIGDSVGNGAATAVRLSNSRSYVVESDV